MWIRNRWSIVTGFIWTNIFDVEHEIYVKESGKLRHVVDETITLECSVFNAKNLKGWMQMTLILDSFMIGNTIIPVSGLPQNAISQNLYLFHDPSPSSKVV